MDSAKRENKTNPTTAQRPPACLPAQVSPAAPFHVLPAAQQAAVAGQHGLVTVRVQLLVRQQDLVVELNSRAEVGAVARKV